MELSGDLDLLVMVSFTLLRSLRFVLTSSLSTQEEHPQSKTIKLQHSLLKLLRPAFAAGSFGVIAQGFDDEALIYYQLIIQASVRERKTNSDHRLHHL